jgi:hypothetical protein
MMVGMGELDGSAESWGVEDVERSCSGLDSFEWNMGGSESTLDPSSEISMVWVLE